VLRPEYPILTDRLLLRPLESGDLDPIDDIYRRPKVNRYLYWKPTTRDEVAEWLAVRTGWSALQAAGDTLALAAVLPGSGDFVGNVVLKWLSAEHRSGEVGFSFHPDHHGHGYAGEASRVMLRLGFEGLGLHRIIGRCDGRNKASARVMEKLGMRREAHLRENEFIDGEWCDEYVYAMLAREWTGRGLASVTATN
jgi:RimJ/RimL family protein N-acetyltransferase